MAPTTHRQWTVEGQTGFESLKLDEKASVPQLGDKDVLVKSMIEMFSSKNLSGANELHSTFCVSKLP